MCPAVGCVAALAGGVLSVAAEGGVMAPGPPVALDRRTDLRRRKAVGTGSRRAVARSVAPTPAVAWRGQAGRAGRGSRIVGVLNGFGGFKRQSWAPAILAVS